jgi:hypothetical protein
VGAATAKQAAPPPSRAPEPESEVPYNQVPPQLPSAVKQVYLPVQISFKEAMREMGRDRNWSVRSDNVGDGYLVYEPALAGLAQLRFVHNKSRQTHAEDVAYLLRLEGEGYVVDWGEGEVQLVSGDLEREPEPDAYFAELPSGLGATKRHAALKSEFEDYLYYNSSIRLLYNPHLELYSEVGESAEAFQRRCRKEAKKALDAAAKKLRAKYEKELDRLDDRLDREERELEQDKIEHDARKQEEVLSGVESLVGLLGRKRLSSRLSSASRRRRMTRQAKADIEESEEAIDELEGQIEELEAEAKAEVEELTEKWNALIDELEEEEVRPRRADVRLNLFALAWVPRWEVMVGEQALSMSAFEPELA